MGSTSTGHQATLSSPVMARGPTFPSDPLASGYPTDAEWTVTTAELEALLRLSHNLGFDEEITPVQAWLFITQHFKFILLSNDDIDTLKHVLDPLVQCYR